MHPLAIHTETAIVSPRLFGSVGWYASLAQFSQWQMDFSTRYDKRNKATHRFEIADHGKRRTLTIPVSRPQGAFLEGNLEWKDIMVSPHGRWWETIPVALESAYGRSPFFQYCFPLFEELFVDPGENTTLESFVNHADSIVRKFLTLPPSPEKTIKKSNAFLMDNNKPEPNVRPYWQISGSEFIEGLSILDLIFNQGLESPLFLRLQ